MAIDHNTAAEGAYQREINSVDDMPAPIQTLDGYIVDPDTGEVLGSTDPRPEETKAQVDWYLQKRALAEANKDALTHEMNLLIAGIRERFETRIAEQERKLVWLDANNEGVARQFAMEQIAFSGKSLKSFKHAWATLGFRASRETLKVTDAEKAFSALVDGETVKYEPIRLTFDLGQFPDDEMGRDQAQLVVIAGELMKTKPDAVKVDILTSRIEGPDRETLPDDAFEFRPAGLEQEFYIKHEAKKAGEVG